MWVAILVLLFIVGLIAMILGFVKDNGAAIIIWEEAIKAVLAKQGKKYYLPTLTEDAFNEAIRKKHEETKE